MTRSRVAGWWLVAAIAVAAAAQTKEDLPVLRGLAPVSALASTENGRAALAANYRVTADIQTGVQHQATLLPYLLQREQALEDAFSTSGNLAQLSDGLGSTLGAAYTARFHNIDASHVRAMPEALSTVIAYATGITGPHSGLAKYFFANETTDGKHAVTAEAAAILKRMDGHTDPFGRAYGLPAGSAGGDKFGDARPFQTEKRFTHFSGPDYLNRPADDAAYNAGPLMNLTESPSYPSGHTTYGYTGAVLLAVLVPERYSEMIARGAEYGNDRILMGSHYAMDVLGGRTLALYDMAHLLSNDKGYLGRTVRGATPITDFQLAIKDARAALLPVLEANCGEAVAVCAKEDLGRFDHARANEEFYASTQTYGLGVVHAREAEEREDVGKVAPEAGYLLTQAFPGITLEQADRILTETEGPGGGFLDDGSAFGVYSRIDLYAAGERAAEMAAKAKAVASSAP